MKPEGRKFLLIVAMVVMWLILVSVRLWGESDVRGDTMYNKVMCGYQGWFSAGGDALFYPFPWEHWCVGGMEPAPNTITIDIWPDYREYPHHTLFYSNGYRWTYPDGRAAGFFSSNLEETILLHCKWMRDYGIDGIFLQRFTAAFDEFLYQGRKNQVLHFILKGARQYDLKVAVMYDVTGTPLREIADRVREDWRFLVDVMKIHENPNYQYHPDKNDQHLPVVGVWGFGFFGTGTKGQASDVISFFKESIEPRYRATLVGGVPGYWRFGDHDSKAEYEAVYNGFDIVSPWTVGRFGDREGVAAWRYDVLAGDMALTSSRGQQYLPVSFPGFSNANLRKNLLNRLTALPENGIDGKRYLLKATKGELNEIPRDGGHFMWDQFYHWVHSGNNMFYVAMFDEVDEATAVFKLAENNDHVPEGNLFLHLDSDGYRLQSDHYLWLCGSAGFIVKQGFPFPPTQPRRFPGENFKVERVSSRGFLAKDEYINIGLRIVNDDISSLILYKQTGSAAFYPVLTLNRDHFQGGEYIFKDEAIENKIKYAYIVVAFDGEGIPVSLSNISRK
jgi:hypothetical protein